MFVFRQWVLSNKFVGKNWTAIYSGYRENREIIAQEVNEFYPIHIQPHTTTKKTAGLPAVFL